VAATIVSIKYDSMNQVSGEFQTQEAIAKQVSQTLTEHLTILKQGGWMAPSADQFYKTMDDEVMPGIQRLITALDQASQTIAAINATMQSGEQTASGLLPK
jgi:WXG100 family type VII secretion target